MKLIKYFIAPLLLAIAPVKSMDTDEVTYDWQMSVTSHRGLIQPTLIFSINGLELGRLTACGYRNRAGINEYCCQYSYPNQLHFEDTVYGRIDVMPCPGKLMSNNDLAKIGERYYHFAIKKYASSANVSQQEIGRKLQSQINSADVDQKRNAELQEHQKLLSKSMNEHMRTAQELNQDHFMMQLNNSSFTSKQDADELAALAAKYQD